MTSDQFNSVALITAAPLIVAGMISDLRSRRIPNWVVASLLAVALVAAPVHAGLSGLGQAVVGMLLGFGLLLPLYCAGAMGAGDVKFLAVIGAWVGVTGTLWAFAIAALLGAGPALLSLITSRSGATGLTHFWLLFVKCSTRNVTAADFVAPTGPVNRKTFPYGVFLGLAGLAILSARVFTELEV